MAGGRVENRLGKDQRTRRGRVFQRFIVEPSRVIDAAVHHTENDPQADGAIADACDVRAQSLERGGNRILADGTGATQTRVGGKSRAAWWRGNLPDAQGSIPARPWKIIGWERQAFGKRLAQGQDAPARRR